MVLFFILNIIFLTNDSIIEVYTGWVLFMGLKRSVNEGWTQG